MVLAIRGVENDQALLERSVRENHIAIATQISAELRDSLDALAARALTRYVTRTGSTDVTESLPPGAVASAGVEQLFLFDRRRRTLDFAGRPALYGSARYPGVFESASWPDHALEAGEESEFRRHDLREALARYREALSVATDRRSKALALAAIGRVQRKGGHHELAIRTLEELLSQYSDVWLYGTTPVAPSALIELAGLCAETGMIRRAVLLADSMYRNLITSVWPLDRGAFDYYTSRCTTAIRTLLHTLRREDRPAGIASRLDSLIHEETRLRTRTERLHHLRQHLPGFLEGATANLAVARAASPEHAVLEIDSCLYLIATSADTGPNECAGVVLDTGYVLSAVLTPVMERNLADKQVPWAVVDRRGGIVATSGVMSGAGEVVRHALRDGYPPWTIELATSSYGLLQVLVSPEKSLYGIIVLLAFVILVAGSLSTIQLLSRELHLVQMKSDFVSTVSHEFKSPLTAIRQLAEMLQAGRVPDGKKQQQYYDVIVEQSERVSILIDNILDFAKMEEGKKVYNFERTDIVMLLQEIVLRVQHQFLPTGRKIRSAIPDHLPLMAVDRIAFSQAITNTLDNAMKFSGNAEYVDIHAAHVGSEVIVSITDYGCGIPREELSSIFERFYRGRGQQALGTKGSGLGLTLVHHVVGAHGGTINVESVVGKGSTFALHFPILPDPEKNEVSKSSQSL